jgi:hypothetical protein
MMMKTKHLSPARSTQLALVGRCIATTAVMRQGSRPPLPVERPTVVEAQHHHTGPRTAMGLPPLWREADEEDHLVGDDEEEDGERVARWMGGWWAEMRVEGERQRAIRQKADRELQAALARVRDLQAHRLRGRTNKAGLPTLD